MKTFEYLFLIIFILSNAGVKSGSYSIDTLLDYLKEKEYYEIIYQIKLIFGDDIAISVCMSFVASNQCEDVVRTYMTSAGSGSGSNRAPIRVPTEDDLNLRCKFILSRIFIPPSKRPVVICILYHYDTLIKNMTENEIIELIQKYVGIKSILRIPNKDLVPEIDKKY